MIPQLPTTNLSLPPEYAPYVYLISGVLMMFFGIIQWKKANRLSKHGIKTEGTLVRVIPNRSISISIGSGSQHSHRRENTQDGIYRFTDTQGREHEVRGAAPGYPVIGESTATILYHPDQPSDAIVSISGVPQLVPMIVSLVGIGTTAYGIFQLPL